MDAWVSAFRAVVDFVVPDEILDGLDVCVVHLREVVAEVVVEVGLDVCVFGFVRVATSSAIVPVPASGRDDLFVMGEFSAVDDGCTGGLDQMDQLQELGDFIGLTECPERFPWETEYGALKHIFFGKELSVAVLGCLRLLS